MLSTNSYQKELSGSSMRVDGETTHEEAKATWFTILTNEVGGRRRARNRYGLFSREKEACPA